jgi:outer membrane protein OmpA-like peptidoglycan-associated protein
MSFRSAGAGCVATLFVSLAVAGCGSLGYKESQTYRSAQQQLAEAKRDPAVRQHGRVFLRDAEETLNRARAAGGDRALADHLSYLALRKAEIAQSIAGLQVASANLQTLAEKSIARDAIPPQVDDHAIAADKEPKRERSARPGSAGSLAVATPTAGTSAGKDGKSKSAPSLPGKKPAADSMDTAVGAALESAAARSDPRSAVLSISGIGDAGDRARLSSDARHSLSPLLAYLRDNQDSRIIIEGYTDGNRSHEDALSQSLGVAETVKTYLTDKGIDGDRIFTLGRGTDGAAGTGEAVGPDRRSGRIEIGLFRGIGDPSPALTARGASSAPPPP